MVFFPKGMRVNSRMENSMVMAHSLDLMGWNMRESSKVVRYVDMVSSSQGFVDSYKHITLISKLHMELTIFLFQFLLRIFIHFKFEFLKDYSSFGGGGGGGMDIVNKFFFGMSLLAPSPALSFCHTKPKLHNMRFIANHLTACNFK